MFNKMGGLDCSNPLLLGALQLHAQALMRQRPDKAYRLQRCMRPLRRAPFNVQGLTGREPLTTGLALEHIQQTTKGFTGVWRKDPELSDSLEEACEVGQLPWILRKAVHFLTRIEIEDTGNYFQTTVKAGGVLDLVERYPWDGTEVTTKRRDKRKGFSKGRVEGGPEGPRVSIQWPSPLQGGACEEYSLSEDGQILTQMTRIKIIETGQECSYRSVYHRVKKWHSHSDASIPEPLA